MGKENQDLVIVFDIESGVYDGPTDQITLTDTPVETALMRILRMYNYDTIVRDDKKITLPRYVSVGIMPWDTFQRGCYSDPELAFRYKMDYYVFLLSEHGGDRFLDFWRDVLDHVVNRGSILLLGHNANYDINGILNACRSQTGNRLVDLNRSWLEEYKGQYMAFPESIHDDKTFDLHFGTHHLRMIDTLNLSPGHCRTLKQYGIRASSMYKKNYRKGDQYDYDYRIRTATDILPTRREYKYTQRDLQLCVFAAMMAVYQYRAPLEGRGSRYRIADFPFSATQRDKAVNDGLTVLMRFPGATKTKRKEEFRKIQKGFKLWCERWGNVHDVDTYLMLQHSATGGIISCNESYVNKPVEDVGSMDLSSSYPACAGDFWYPRIEENGYYTGPLPEDVFRDLLASTILPLSKELRSGKLVLDDLAVNHKYRIGMSIGFCCKLRFHNIIYHDFGTDSNGLQYWLPVLTYKDFEEGVNREQLATMRGKVIDNEQLEYYCTHIGLCIILAFYDVECIEYLGGYSYEMCAINRTIHDRFKAGLIGKQKAKQIRKDWEKHRITDDDMIAETGLAYLIGQDEETIRDELQAYYDSSKVPLNAMYGSSYRRLLREQRVILENGDYELTDGEYSPAISVAYPTGLYIAIYGQLKIAHAILWAISKRLPILYVHTDSLKIQGLTPELVAEYNELIKEPADQRDGEPVSFRSYGIGLMDYEGSHDLGIVIGNMRIVTWDRDSGYHITMSGLNEQKAFPRKKIRNMDFFDFCQRYLTDGQKYSLESDTQSGKTITDYSLAGLYVPGIGYSMQSILDAEFILNNPASPRQANIVSVYDTVVGDYHTVEWYAKKKYVIRKAGQNNGSDESTNKSGN